jgi:hypothetical protein
LLAAAIISVDPKCKSLPRNPASFLKEEGFAMHDRDHDDDDDDDDDTAIVDAEMEILRAK